MHKIKKIIVKYNKPILISLVLIVLFLGGIVVSGKTQPASNIDVLVNEEVPTIVVEIVGEVKYPGKYIVKRGTKIKELIFISGGLLKDSDITLINLNGILEEEDVIMVNKSFDKTKRININTATLKEIADLDNIGTVTAAKIILRRITKGPFKTLQDLADIDGINEKIIIDLIDEITLS